MAGDGVREQVPRARITTAEGSVPVGAGRLRDLRDRAEAGLSTSLEPRVVLAMVDEIEQRRVGRDEDSHPLIVLCGSVTRHMALIDRVHADLAAEGAHVLAPLPAPGADVAVLDAAWRAAIERADQVIAVTDESGVLGSSTSAELAYARERRVPCFMRQVPAVSEVDTDSRPARGGSVESWVKRWRDQRNRGDLDSRMAWQAVDMMLDDLRDRSDIGASWPDRLDQSGPVPEIIPADEQGLSDTGRDEPPKYVEVSPGLCAACGRYRDRTGHLTGWDAVDGSGRFWPLPLGHMPPDYTVDAATGWAPRYQPCPNPSIARSVPGQQNPEPEGTLPPDNGAAMVSPESFEPVMLCGHVSDDGWFRHVARLGSDLVCPEHGQRRMPEGARLADQQDGGTRP